MYLTHVEREGIPIALVSLAIFGIAAFTTNSSEQPLWPLAYTAILAVSITLFMILRRVYGDPEFEASEHRIITAVCIALFFALTWNVSDWLGVAKPGHPFERAHYCEEVDVLVFQSRESAQATQCRALLERTTSVDGYDGEGGLTSISLYDLHWIRFPKGRSVSIEHENLVRESILDRQHVFGDDGREYWIEFTGR